MGQKINPVGFRLAVNRNWSSRWYANSKNFAPMLAEDIKVRGFLKSKLAHASVGRVLIERPAKDARITIFSARPGVVIGKKGEEIEALKARSEEHTSELQSRLHLVCRLLLEKKNHQANRVSPHSHACRFHTSYAAQP